MFEACGPFQWAREFLKNAEEAKATRVEFGIDWEAVETHGEYRRIVADNGEGMDRDELFRFFSKLGDGAKPIGGVHDNFGVGAKIASLPWNPRGVVVLTWKDGKGSMIWIRHDPETDNYVLEDFVDDEEKRVSVLDLDAVDWDDTPDDEVNWSRVKPDWIEDHGTVVVLLGSDEHPDTVLGNPDAKEDDLKGLSLYLNTRFWDLGDIDVHVVELSTHQKNHWPTSLDDDSSGRTQRRRARGAKYYLTDVGGQASGSLAASDYLLLDEERVDCEWYLWNGERPNIGPYAKRGGYIALRYKGELFHVTSRKVEFRWFGIIESEVQHRTTIILEPRHYGQGGGKWGVHPDQSRNRLLFSGAGDKGAEVPLADWGLEFAEHMPSAIREAIMEARGDLAAQIEDEEYRKRLQDKFGDRWKTKRLVASKSKKNATEPTSLSDEEEDGAPDLDLSGGGGGGRRKRKKGGIRVRRKRAVAGDDGPGRMHEAPVDVPRIDFQRAEAFDKPWHLAMWAPNDPEGPTVYINTESGILQDVVEYHQEKYPEVYQDEVAKIVRQVFGEVAACKVAHSQKLVHEVTEEELDATYRSEAALTIGLMGLIAEESLIAPRLGRFGRKKD